MSNDIFDRTSLHPATRTLPPQGGAQQTLINVAWQTTRRALIMIGRTWGQVAETYKDRNASIASDIAHAAANVIERRLK